MNLIDITGQRFGRLVVTKMLPKARCECLCDCGNVTTPLHSDVRHGKTKSCGCTVSHHGMKHTPEYSVWTSMLQRCENPNNKDYHYYGERGITVCPEWHDFAVFIADMGVRPSGCQTIDRIDNDKGYELSNCRWTTWKRQQRNTSRTIKLDYGGLMLPLCDLAELTGLDSNVMRYRYHAGWSIDRMLARG